MSNSLQKYSDLPIAALKTLSLSGIQRGIEKEALRISADGFIAQTAHPVALGAALTHPSITTDYSEALLEFITPKLTSADESINFLQQLHSYTLDNIGDELVWPASMPCRLDGDESIQIARYGSSNVGQMKHVYRRGLGVRYGRIMQSIAGIHYNFSLSNQFWLDYQQHLGETGDLKDFKSKHYFTLVRNFRCHSWLLLYLFGASPVLDRSFLDGRKLDVDKFLPNTYGLKYATSLRMSDLGYQNAAQEVLRVSYNSLDEYTETLAEAVSRPYPAYQKLGVKNAGQYQQLNTNILQLENEYYSDIRPKRVTHSGEKPIHALRSRGIEYIEVRVLDINPFLAAGIDSQQVCFLDAFLLHCLVSGCDRQSASDCQQIRENQRKVILSGRDPKLELASAGKMVSFQSAGNSLLDNISLAAQLLDDVNSTNDYTLAVDYQREKILDAGLTPSGQIMERVDAGVEFIEQMVELAQQHKQCFTRQSVDSELTMDLPGQAKQSIVDQRNMEQADTLAFEEYLDAYNNR